VTDFDRRYYRDKAAKTFRVVQMLAPEVFVVVKIFEGRTRTVKFWQGDLDECEKHWRTRVFEPTREAKRLLDTDFACTIQEFGPSFQLALSLSA
jgi:hypothetical protein